MLNLDDEIIRMHQEEIRREACIQRAIRQSGLARPSLISRVLPALGDVMIRMGTRLKQHAYPAMKADEASVPTFLIML